MKIAATSVGDSLNDQISNMFGRCPFFIVAGVEEGEIKNIQSLENQSKGQRGGVGMAAAQKMGDEGVGAIITGNVGPNAFNVLQKLDIDVYKAEETTVKENFDLFSEGDLEKAKNPTGGPGGGKGRRGRFNE